MKKKLLLILLSIGIVSTCITGCDDSSSREEKSYTEESMNNALDAVGLPNVSNYYERSQLKSIYELRDDPELVCYWYTKNSMTGKWVYEGKCIGYGIPYGASMTSPEQYAYNGATLPLAEPNGIYTNGVTSSATWILCVGEEGDVKPQYVEQEIRVSQTKINADRCEEWSIPSDY